LIMKVLEIKVVIRALTRLVKLKPEIFYSGINS